MRILFNKSWVWGYHQKYKLFGFNDAIDEVSKELVQCSISFNGTSQFLHFVVKLGNHPVLLSVDFILLSFHSWYCPGLAKNFKTGAKTWNTVEQTHYFETSSVMKLAVSMHSSTQILPAPLSENNLIFNPFNTVSRKCTYMELFNICIYSLKFKNCILMLKAFD